MELRLGPAEVEVLGHTARTWSAHGATTHWSGSRASSRTPRRRTR
ncbi:hypothetical protein [Kribbella capetownensis]|nr:hypothetical protein [Kribbella capetownensis]